MFWVKFFVLAAFVLTNFAAKPAIRELSEEEDLELERELKLMNKSPIKTIEVRALILFFIIFPYTLYLNIIDSILLHI